MILLIIVELLLISFLYVICTVTYSNNEFSTMLTNKACLSILSGNIYFFEAKFDVFQSFVQRVRIFHSISVICQQERWLDEKRY